MRGKGSEVDITEGLLKHVTILYCRDCETYLQPPDTQIEAEVESSELLRFCLEQLNLDEAEVTLVHACFVFTEPHTNRIKVKLKVRKEAVHGEVLEQVYIVEYVVQLQMCNSCSRLQSNLEPRVVATVQLRQQAPHHQRTLFYLEQVILKHDAAAHAIGMKKVDYGIDFFFSTRIHGVKFVEFVGKVAPIKSWSDKELVSYGAKRNKYYYKYTFYVEVEVLSICEEDLARNGIMFVDPNPMR